MTTNYQFNIIKWGNKNVSIKKVLCTFEHEKQLNNYVQAGNVKCGAIYSMIVPEQCGL